MCLLQIAPSDCARGVPGQVDGDRHSDGREKCQEREDQGCGKESIYRLILDTF